MADNIPRCNHFVLRKKRYCKMSVKKGQQYCGEHQIASGTPNQLLIPQKSELCALWIENNIVTCYAHNLEKHLKICNSRETTPEAFISKGINSGDDNNTDNTYNLLSTYSVFDIKNTVSKVNQIYKRFIEGKISKKILSHKLIEEEMSKPEYGDNTKKHLKQASAILQLLNEYDMIKPKTCYIEFGAGRGQLSYWISKATESNTGSTVLLIERASPKHKRDNKLAKTIDQVQRIRADIADLILDKVNAIGKTENIVGVTKHLCGEATDLALRCLGNIRENKDKLQGVIFSFCCHHRCRWIPYTGREFFEENQLSKDNFNIMCNMASWATCGTGLSRQKQASNEAERSKQNERDIEIGLNKEQKEDIGRKSKNIINWGRLVYLEKLGFKCALHYYVESTISLENVCVVAHR
ncbi:hypothetical protein NQ317_005512 [Molorchus minor]|uniref:tRNA:m(4)X modification enzyme TRM13 n=1 Tax=Molorchus minor TaxID=1323400 RepID=A0ABQ9IXB8_9CUCU|nr:hypothetical protein NQ317_005512 [Molorchus minor]